MMERWHARKNFDSPAHCRTERENSVQFHELVRPHAGIGGMTPSDSLIEKFDPQKPQTALGILLSMRKEWLFSRPLMRGLQNHF